MIRVGVDAWNLPGDRRGIGRYVRALLSEWEHFRDRIIPTLIVPEWHTWTVAGRYRAELSGERVRVVSRRYHSRANLDLLWFPFNGPSWTAFALPSVATLHDASTFVLPGFDEAARATFRLAASRCTHIVTDSEFSKRELVRELGLSETRITAVPLGIAPPSPPTQVPLEIAAFGRYVLFVGENEPRKGYDTLVAALQELARNGTPIALVVAGEPKNATVSGGSFPIYILGHVDDATLAALYRQCTIFVYPSRYEGFGLPVLEAMSYGAPVIASAAAATPEAGGDAALYFAPNDSNALAETIDNVWSNPALANTLRERGRERAAAMAWRRTAEKTLAVFEMVAGQ